MCAGVYVDHGYRDELLRGVYNAVSRRVAPSYGCDVVAVLQHAWRAWWISLAEHMALVVFVAVALIRVTLDTVIVVSVLAVWALAGRVRAWAAEAVRHASGRKTELDARQIRARGRLLGSGLAVAAGAAAAAMIAGAAGRAGGGWAARTGIEGAGVILAGCAAIVAAAVGARMACLARLRRRPLRGPGLRRRLAVIDDQQKHPVTVHSGFRPFIGSGLNVQSWSFAQRLVRRKVLGTEPDQEFDVLPFTTADLIGRLKQTMTGIRDDDDPGTGLPNLTVTDRVFVQGTRAAPFRQVLQNDPASYTVRHAISEAVAIPGDVARHYLQCRAGAWGGEVVTSVFAHVSLQGRALYLEFATYVLLPTRAAYRLVDEAGGTGPRAVAGRIAAAVGTLPAQLLAARDLARAPAQLWAGARPRADLTARQWERRRKDIGARVSAREKAAIVPDESYFQFQDSVQHSKIIERRLIATVEDYLNELGVDTSEFSERVAAVLNNGVINADRGTVNISGSAVGHQPTVTSPAATPQP